MAVFTLPKISELAAGQLARGSDVLANDQATITTLNGPNLDQTNIDPAMEPTWTADHIYGAESIWSTDGGVTRTSTISATTGSHYLALGALCYFGADGLNPAPTACAIRSTTAGILEMLAGLGYPVAFKLNGNTGQAFFGDSFDVLIKSGKYLLLNGGHTQNTGFRSSGDPNYEAIVVHAGNYDKMVISEDGTYFYPPVSAPVANNAYHQSMIKAWINIDGLAGVSYSSFNVSSISKVTTGRYLITLITPMLNIDNMAPIATAGFSSSRFITAVAGSASQFEIFVRDSSGSLTDTDCAVAIVGIQ